MYQQLLYVQHYSGLKPPCILFQECLPQTHPLVRITKSSLACKPRATILVDDAQPTSLSLLTLHLCVYCIEHQKAEAASGVCNILRQLLSGVTEMEDWLRNFLTPILL